jgi:hypothetical protein
MDPYLYKQSVHKDFHGVLNLLFDYLDENYGKEEMLAMYREIIKETYEPLIREIKNRGLHAMMDHYNDIMQLEEGDHSTEFEQGRLKITVNRCPAIEHLHKSGAPVSQHFCQVSTVLVNEVIGEETGFRCTVNYDQQKGTCTQVWEEAQ